MTFYYNNRDKFWVAQESLEWKETWTTLPISWPHASCVIHLVQGGGGRSMSDYRFQLRFLSPMGFRTVDLNRKPFQEKLLVPKDNF